MTQEPFEPEKSLVHFICHQDPARSFFIKGRQMTLCARCTGFYFGLVGGVGFLVILLLLIPDFNLTTFNVFLLLIVGVAPLAIDGVTQLFELRASTNLLRLVTGLNCGFWLGTILIWIGYDIIIW